MPQVARRLPHLALSEEPPAFEIGRERWNEIEALVGPIPADARAEIVNAIREYLWLATATLSAGDLDGATGLAAQFQTAFARARATLSSSSTSDAHDLVLVMFGRNLHHPLILEDLSHEIKIELLASVLRAGEAACAETIDELAGNDHAGPPVRRHWAALMRRLTLIFSDEGLPTGVSKDVDATARQSPFVYVIDLMQSCLAPQYRHSEQSLSALAVAISKARRV
ncbi:hypothetical protein [Bradyrhizobium sp. 76]|uniref:hypothetical protein n=1 Tax=Bradyrhizobium sp. 76 TaxID=2782680 RepID=UPI001FF8292A|nr:hypothetical protein [Bradyrhizobium sp. 76]MCK1403939.1 hypothetical protein [Bradyrhizobium sp. 76]